MSSLGSVLIIFPLAIMSVIGLVYGNLTSTTIYEMIAIATIAVTAALTVMAGLGFFTGGASKSETVLTITFEVAAFGGAWATLSVLSAAPIIDIPILGIVIYVGITFMFVMGVFLHIRGFEG